MGRRVVIVVDFVQVDVSFDSLFLTHAARLFKI